MKHGRPSDLTSSLLYSEVSTQRLFSLNGLEKSLEVTCTEALMVASLDYLQEKGRAVLDRLGEDLEQVALIVIVDENFLPLEHVNILLHLDVLSDKTCSNIVVVGVRDLVKE